MGLCSVKNAVSKYNGAMNISTDNSMFKVQIYYIKGKNTSKTVFLHGEERWS